MPAYSQSMRLMAPSVDTRKLGGKKSLWEGTTSKPSASANAFRRVTFSRSSRYPGTSIGPNWRRMVS